MKLKTAELAALLGLTGRRINQLAAEGVTIKVSPGQFDGPLSIQNFIASVSGKAAGQEVTLDLERERARLAKEQADGHAIKNAVLRNELIGAEDVIRGWSAINRRVRSSMLAVPSRVRSRNPALTAADVATIDREIRDALEALSDEPADDDGASDEIATTATEDSAVDLD